MEVPKTEESMLGKPGTKSYGVQTPGNGNVSFSCPLNREAVHGADRSRRWSLTHLILKHTELPITLTLERPGVTLCACHAPGPSFGERYCVLDAGAKIIIALPAKCAGTVNRPLNVRCCCTGRTGESIIYGTRYIDVMREATRRARLSEKMESGSPSQGEKDDIHE